MAAETAPKRRGLLIVFEGVDGAGKTYNTKRTAMMLGMDTFSMSFPDRYDPVTGDIIDRFLRKKLVLSNREAHLIFSANRWHNAAFIKSALDDGIDVVLDRYLFSGIAYTMARGGIEDIGWIFKPDTGLPMPDLMFFLDVHQEQQEKVTGFGDEIHDQPTTQQKVRESFHTILSGLCIGKHNSQCKIVCLGGDTLLSREDMSQQILKITKAFCEDDANRAKEIQFFKYQSDEL